MKPLIRPAAVLALATLLVGPVTARADVVVQWNEILTDTLAAQGQNPFFGSRIAAITQLAVFEAVNAITGEYEPYLGTIDAPPGASAEAAAIAAAHRVLATMLPAAGLDLDAKRSSSLALVPDGPSKDDGIQVGEAAAAAMLARRANDGAFPMVPYPAPTSGAPGEYLRTDACPNGGIFFNWPGVPTFGLQSADQFRPPPPPPLRTGRYARHYKEVNGYGDINSGSRTADDEALARFYGSTVPPGMWNVVARQLAGVAGGSLSSNARAFALLNMSMADGLISVMETKYHYRFWRPETAIRAGAADGNAKTDVNADFKPLLNTPCYPSYPSGHSWVSNAGRQILQKLWGNGGHSIDLPQAGAPAMVRHYTSLKQITDDIDDARVYAGIHFRFEQDVASRQGTQVANYIFRHYLRPLP
jgi:hypothetical protein